MSDTCWVKGCPSLDRGVRPVKVSLKNSSGYGNYGGSDVVITIRTRSGLCGSCARSIATRPSVEDMLACPFVKKYEWHIQAVCSELKRFAGALAGPKLNHDTIATNQWLSVAVVAWGYAGSIALQLAIRGSRVGAAEWWHFAKAPLEDALEEGGWAAGNPVRVLWCQRQVKNWHVFKEHLLAYQQVDQKAGKTVDVDVIEVKLKLGDPHRLVTVPGNPNAGRVQITPLVVKLGGRGAQPGKMGGSDSVSGGASSNHRSTGTRAAISKAISCAAKSTATKQPRGSKRASEHGHYYGIGSSKSKPCNKDTITASVKAAATTVAVECSSSSTNSELNAVLPRMEEAFTGTGLANTEKEAKERLLEDAIARAAEIAPDYSWIDGFTLTQLRDAIKYQWFTDGQVALAKERITRLESRKGWASRFRKGGHVFQLLPIDTLNDDERSTYKALVQRAEQRANGR